MNKIMPLTPQMMPPAMMATSVAHVLIFSWAATTRGKMTLAFGQCHFSPLALAPFKELLKSS